MKTKSFFKLIPLLTVILFAALVVAPGCKKKMPKEVPPPVEEVAIEEVEPMEEDTTGQAMRELRMEMDRDIARIQIIYFAFDRSEITPTELEKVRSNAEILNKWPDWKVTIEGHCDERGTNEYNLALGERRARAAKRALEAEGIAAGRINLISYGEERPADPGHTERSWDRNRRDEFKIETGMSEFK
ncbi:peptidoglycan-associated lipoprotein Pal [bacterium]|nr:peptidoglycan-associated lipoprotein Pal [bacterium]MBU1636348.1 peptidoglycan-associated lipoprotein Pal [bacterium]MBU1920286.1 peptidoglycan-associated lipoprotein Pal [bacterium]RQV95414.1 MAG: peptidoglycan-associated lipoprotein Pal [bacterium]